jgi:hypothetical protein
LLSFRDSVREVRHSDIDLRHTGMQPLERLRDHEAVPLVDTRLHSGLKARHRGLDLTKPLSDLEFGLERLDPPECHSGKDVARQQAQSELVRIVKNPRLGGCQIQR